MRREAIADLLLFLLLLINRMALGELESRKDPHTLAMRRGLFRASVVTIHGEVDCALANTDCMSA